MTARAIGRPIAVRTVTVVNPGILRGRLQITATSSPVPGDFRDQEIMVQGDRVNTVITAHRLLDTNVFIVKSAPGTRQHVTPSYQRGSGGAVSRRGSPSSQGSEQRGIKPQSV